jgi:hypothetical protein
MQGGDLDYGSEQNSPTVFDDHSNSTINTACTNTHTTPHSTAHTTHMLRGVGSDVADTPDTAQMTLLLEEEVKQFNINLAARNQPSVITSM